MRLSFLGGVGTVTGSKYLLEADDTRILIDCGLFQGYKQLRLRNWAPLPIDPAAIDTVVLTHAHLDHSGYLPLLVRNGFAGRVISTLATRDLCQILLPDSGHLQEREAEFASRHGFSKHHPAQPLYTQREAEASMARFDPLDYEIAHDLGDGLTVRLFPAGHILGSSILELWLEADGETIKVVFSGDLGKQDQLIVKDPHEVFDADYLFVESTYGNRRHRSFEDSKLELVEAIKYSVSHNEKIIIPAFAVERTQEILYILRPLSI